MTRRDLIVYVSARNCNPNGDMDRDNRPRQDDLTGLGQISAVSSKRRIKSAVQQMFDVPMLIDPSLISIESKAKEVLANIDPAKLDEMTPLEKDKAIKKAICEKYWDVRTFGAAIASLSKKDNNSISDGQITGPVQVEWAESLQPIELGEEPKTITRCNASTDADLAKKPPKRTDIGTQWIVPYAQYAFEVHVSGANDKTGFSDKDYEMLLEGTRKMWMLNQTSSKAGMEVDAVIEFTHESKFGNASPSSLRKCIVLTPHEEIIGRISHDISVDDSKVPEGVTYKIYR